MQFVVIGFPAVIAFLGAMMVGLGVWSYRRSSARYRAATTSWVVTTGRIDKAWLQSVSTKTTTNDPLAMASTTYFAPRVAFSYQAGGSDRQGSEPLLIAQGTMTRDDATKWLDGVPAGAVVPVSYDPANPDDAVLVVNPPPTLMILWMGLVGVAMIVSAVPIYRSLQP